MLGSSTSILLQQQSCTSKHTQPLRATWACSRNQVVHEHVQLVRATTAVSVRLAQRTAPSRDHAATGVVQQPQSYQHGCQHHQQWQQQSVDGVQQMHNSPSTVPPQLQHHHRGVSAKQRLNSNGAHSHHNTSTMLQQHHHTQQARSRLQQEGKRINIKAAVRQCSTWEQLAAYLTSERHLQNQAAAQASRAAEQHQQQHAVKTSKLWSQLDGQQAQLVLQHATELASLQRRQPWHKHAQPDASTATVQPGASRDFETQAQLLQILSQLLIVASNSIANGDAVSAAQVLRAAWKLQLTNHNSSQQRKLQHQLLDLMCRGCGHAPAVTTAAHDVQSDTIGAEQSDRTENDPELAIQQVFSGGTNTSSVAADASGAAGRVVKPPPIRNANLLADVAAAVVQHHLKPSSKWKQWYRHSSMDLMQLAEASNQSSVQQQQQQKGSGVPGAWFLVNALQLAVYCKLNFLQHGQQQEAEGFPDQAWLQAWTTAAANASYPFTPNQLLIVMSAAEQLPLQVPGSFINRHLAPESITVLSEQQLLRVLAILGHLQQQCKQQLRLSDTWLQVAADSLSAAAAVVTIQQHQQQQHVAAMGATERPVTRLLPGAVRAAAQLHLPVSTPQVTQLIEALLTVPAEQQHDRSMHSRTLAAAVETPDSSSSKLPTVCALRQVSASEACATVVALVQLSKHHTLEQHLASQLQQQLRPMLAKADTDTIIALFWALVVNWKVSISKPFLSLFLNVTRRRLPRCSANELRMLSIGLVTTAAQQLIKVPDAWMSKFLQCTTVILQQQQPMPLQQQLPALHAGAAPAAAVHYAAFISNTACCLARLQVVPDPQWQAMWRQQVLASLGLMTPEQLADVLYAAAVWSVASATVDAGLTAQMAATRQAPAVQQDTNIHQLMHTGSARGHPVSARHVQVVPEPKSPVGQSQQQLLVRPVFTPPAPSTPVPAPPTGIYFSSSPSEVWVNAVLLQLLRNMQRCMPKQLTTVLWCLRKLQFKAAVPWLDALYDRLLAQVGLCSLLQLQQLLRGLLHQNLQLAPARIDLVLQAALQTMQPGQYAVNSSSSSTVQCTEQQLVWLLQLVVRLKHDPEPGWARAAARVAQQMLRQISSRGRWDAVLLTELLENLAQLGPQLPPRWMISYRRAVWNVGLRRFTGLQLARVLSALAVLHCSTVAKPFMQLVFRRLGQQLSHMDPHALGLAGVAAGQLGLVPARPWIGRYLQRVQHLVRSRVRVPISDAGNLQRSVQYFRWCYVQRRVAPIKKGGRLTSQAYSHRMPRGRTWRSARSRLLHGRSKSSLNSKTSIHSSHA